MEHPAVAEAGVIGKPDPLVGEMVKAFVALKRGHAPSDELRRELLGFARTRLGPAVAPQEIDFRDSCRRRAAARSCGACSRRASSGCPRAICRRWRRTRDRVPPPGQLPDRGARPAPAARDAAHPPLRGEVRRALQRGEDPRLPASLHRRGGGRGRRHAGAGARRRGRRHLPRARPRAGARHLRRGDHGRDVRQAGGLQPRPRRLDAPVRRGDPLLRRQRDRRRRPAARRRARARRPDARTAAASPPASSAKAPWPRASSTSR